MSDVENVIATEALLAAYTQELEMLRDLLQVTQIEKCRLLAQVEALKARLIDFEKNGAPD